MNGGVAELAVINLAVISGLNLGSYNTQVVLLGASLLGMAAGLIGTFLFLRKRSLIGDVVGHCALPGIAVAFLVIESVTPGTGKNMPVLLFGAAVAGLLGAQTVALIRRYSRVDNDTALAVVLSAFYGGGVALLSAVQRLGSGSSAGLKDFLNGQTASIVGQDLWGFMMAAVVITVATTLVFKELALLCFDEEFAAAQGLPVRALDLVLTLLAAGGTVIGMQTVGLLLVTAILVTPPATARFWTNDIRVMAFLSAALGAIASIAGILVSASASRLPAGPMIVISGVILFLLSLAFGRQRGVVWQWWLHRSERNRTDRIDLLRALYDALSRHPEEQTTTGSIVRGVVRLSHLEQQRTWSRSRLRRTLHRCRLDGLLATTATGDIAVTQAAWAEGARISRNRRLWDQYLLLNSDVSPASIDRNSEVLDHLLDPELVAQLEAEVQSAGFAVTTSPTSSGQ